MMIRLVISIAIVLFIFSCCTSKNEKINRNINYALGIEIDNSIKDAHFYYHSFIADYIHPYVIYIKFSCDSLLFIHYIKDLRLYQYGKLPVLDTLQSSDFSHDTFWEMTSVSSIEDKNIAQEWWNPSLDFKKNYGGFYSDTPKNHTVAHFEESWNGRILAQYCHNEMYIFIYCYADPDQVPRLNTN